jgi:hypothetical protein
MSPTMKDRIVFITLGLIVLADLVWLASAPSWWMLPSLLAGWYAADAMSGAVHMWMDYHPTRAGLGLKDLFFYAGSRESADYLAMRDRIMPQLGPLERLIYDFKNHHPRPDALGRRSTTVHLRSTSLFATLPFAILANLAFLLLPLPLWLLAGTFSFILGATFAQYFHASLHRADNPRWVLLLRRLRLLMRPDDHVLHHRTLTQDFSTITGWSNPALNVVFNALRRSGRMREDGLIPR